MARSDRFMISALIIAACSVPAHAAEPASWFAHVGPGRLSTSDDADLQVLGQAVAGAAVRMDRRYTAVLEIGRFVRPGLSLSISAGLPVKQAIDGGGSIRPYGRLGRIVYGPAAATVQWHPLRGAAVRPYVGAGVAYLHVFDADDAAVANLHVDDAAGPVVQGGFEVPVGRVLALFVDAKKAFLRTDAVGTLNAAPIRARLRMDPLVLHAGAALRF